MTLAASMLKGYGYNTLGGAGVYESSEQFIQNATIDFIMESSNLFQTYLTSEIIAQTQVLTEGAEPDVLLEGVVKSFLKNMWEAIKKFITKIKQWITGFISTIKTKWKVWRSSKVTKTVEVEVKKRDKDEKIPVPKTAPKPPQPSVVTSPSKIPQSNTPLLTDNHSDDLYPVILYDIDAGVSFYKKFVDNLYSIDDAIDEFTDEGSLDVNSIGDKFPYNSLEDFKKCVKDAIGFDPDNIDSEVMRAFNADKTTNVSLTVGIVNSIIEDSKAAGKAIEGFDKSLLEIKANNDRIERRWKAVSDTLSLPDQVLQKLQMVYNCSTYSLQLMTKATATGQNIVTCYISQIEIVSRVACAAFNGTASTVKEGYDPIDDGVF